MDFLSFLLIIVCVITGVRSAPQGNQLLTRQSLTSTSSGTNNGYYYEYWSDGNSQEEVTLGPEGSYNVTWSSSALPFIIGKGWNPGSAQTINYTGNFTIGSGPAYLSVYGWTLSPLVEYRIMEYYSTFDPSPNNFFAYMGNLTSDGGLYQIYARRPPNEGLFPEDAFSQYWSIRTNKRIGGTVTTANHFNAWKALGMNLGTFKYQIVAI